jgi:hypothetical protein
LTITKEKILRKLKRLGRKGMVLVLLFIGLDTFGQNINQQKLLYLVNGTQKMEVNPELFSITAVDEDGMRYPVSAPLQKEALSGLVFAEKGTTLKKGFRYHWSYILIF